MNKDVLLIRSGQFHLAVPTERILEIVDLEAYHMQQKKDLEVGQQLISLASKVKRGKLSDANELNQGVNAEFATLSQAVWIKQMLQQTGVTLNTVYDPLPDKMLKKKSHNAHQAAEYEKSKDEFRLWRNHILPVVHLNYVLDPNENRYMCPFSLVHQVSDHEMVYLDIDHIFSIIHIDISQLKPVYYVAHGQVPIQIAPIPSADVLAFVLEDTLSDCLPG